MPFSLPDALIITFLVWIAWRLEELGHELKEEVMSKADEVKAQVAKGFAAIDAATNEIASDLTRLREQVGGITSGMTGEETEALKADLDAKFGPLVARLEELGKDPGDPGATAPTA